MADSFADFEDAPQPPPGANGAAGGKPGTNGHDAGAQAQGKAQKGKAKPRRDYGLIWADDIEIDLDGAGLVDGLLSTTGFTVLYGESGSGKTFAAIDLAGHIAAGLSWRGMKVEQGVVFYIAAERGCVGVSAAVYA
jgi:hypothetical protein